MALCAGPLAAAEPADRNPFRGTDFIKNGPGILVQTLPLTHDGRTIVDGGLLALQAANSYSGGTVVNLGASLQIANDANLGAASGHLSLNGGAVFNTNTMATSRGIHLGDFGGVFVNEPGESLTLNGTVDGQGGVYQVGFGTLVLRGDNRFEGGVFVGGMGAGGKHDGSHAIHGGTLQVSSDANLGALTNTLTIDGGGLTVTGTMATDRGMLIGEHGASITTLDDVTLSHHGDITGRGQLVKLGHGTLAVSGSNTYSGGTFIDGGVIRITAGSSLGTGPIRLNGGTLQASASLGAGQAITITGDAAIRVDAGTTTELTGDLTAAPGGPCLVKAGAGTLNITGAASLGSGACVQEGTLAANGTLDGAFTHVGEAGTLRGIGRIRGPVNTAGTLAGGNAPGALVVEGEVTLQAGATLRVDIDGEGTGNGAGNYSRIVVTGADNHFVAHGTLAPTLRGIAGEAINGYVPALGANFRVVTAEGGVTGRFASVAQPGDGLAANTRFLAFYGTDGGHAIDLRVTPVSYTKVPGISARHNWVAAATALDGVLAAHDAGTATAAQGALLYTVSSLNAESIGTLVSQLPGEVHADEAAAARHAGLGVQRDVADHLDTDEPPTDPAHNAWVSLTRAGSRAISDHQGGGFTTGAGRTTAGIDLYAANGTVVGVAAMHHETHVTSRGGSGSIRGNTGAVYAQKAFASVVIDAMAARGHTRWSAQRTNPLGRGALDTRTSGNDSTASATMRVPLRTAAGHRIEPYVGVIWQKIERDAVVERGAPLAALSLDKLSETGTRLLTGVALGSKEEDPLSATLTWRAGITAGADTGRLLNPTVRNTMVGQRFDTAAPQVGGGFAQASANGTMRLASATYLFAGLTAEAGSGRGAYGVTAGVRVAF